MAGWPSQSMTHSGICLMLKFESNPILYVLGQNISTKFQKYKKKICDAASKLTQIGRA